MQRSGTDMLIHSLPAIFEFCSVFTPLSPGDRQATLLVRITASAQREMESERAAPLDVAE